MIDSAAEVVAMETAAGLVTVAGDATRREVLARGEADRAGRIVIAGAAAAAERRCRPVTGR